MSARIVAGVIGDHARAGVVPETAVNADALRG
jgi:hypothetical protein